MFGSHLSIAGGLHNALLEAERFGFGCVQVFTKNQRQWRVPPLSEQQVRDWHETWRQTGVGEVVSHDSYLINPASPDEQTFEKSVSLLREEIERCERLSIPLLVIHPGAHKGDGEEVGLRRVVAAIDRVHRDLPGYRTVTCLENTAGQGTTLGADLAHLKRIREAVAEPERLAVCIDTAHALAAGYPLTSRSGTQRFLRELDRLVGLELVRAIHINDSKVERGRRVDRHEHIGHGYVSPDAFRTIINRRKLRKVPKILETPKGQGPDGREWDAINHEALCAMDSRAARSAALTGESG